MDTFDPTGDAAAAVDEDRDRAYRFQVVRTPPMMVGWQAEPACPARLFAALASAQGELQNPPKDRTAQVVSAKGQYSYDYADLATVLDTVRPVLAKYRLALMQWPSVEQHEDGVAWAYITTVLTWAEGVDGQYVSGTVGLPLGDTKPQTLGSMQTYLRRYSVQAVCGITGEQDDDASLAQGVVATTGPKGAAAAVPPKPPSSKTITEAQAKFLKVELSRNNVTAKDTVTWYNDTFDTTVKTPLEFLMARFDDVLAWVREGDAMAEADAEPSDE